MGELYFGDFFVKDSKNYIYCVDMMRVTCDISYQTFLDKILSHLSPLMVSNQFKKAIEPIIKQIDDALNSKDLSESDRKSLVKEKKSVLKACKKEFVPTFPYAEEYCKFGFGGFKHNYAIHFAEGVTIYLAFMSNQELNCEDKSQSNPLTKWNLTIEFNPNKIKDCAFLLNILKNNWGWIIKSCDFACDIPCKMEDLLILKNPKHLTQTFERYGIKTIVLGVAPNRIKIYDKKFESNLDYDLTRVEFSVVLDLPLMNYKNYNFNCKSPGICLNQYQLDLKDMDLDIQTKCLLHCLDIGFININDIKSRRIKQKVRDYKMKKSPIEFDVGSFNKTFINYIEFYFSNLVI